MQLRNMIRIICSFIIFLLSTSLYAKNFMGLPGLNDSRSLASRIKKIPGHMSYSPKRLKVIKMDAKKDLAKPLASGNFSGWIYESGLLIGSRNKGSVEGFDLSNDRTVWSFKINGSLSSPILSASEVIYFASSDSFVTKLSLKSGQMIWQKKLPTFSNRSLYKDQNHLYIVSAKHVIYCLDLKEGEVLWSFDPNFEIETKISVRNAAPPLKSKGFIFYGLPNGEIVKLSAKTGQLHWRINFNGNFGDLHDFVGRMVAHNNKLFFCRYDGLVGYIYTEGSSEGKVIQISKSSFFGGCTDSASRSDSFYKADLNGNVSAYSLSSGELEWKGAFNRPISHITPAEKYIFLTTSDGWFQVVSESGVLEWEDKLGETIFARPTFVNPSLSNEIESIYINTGYNNLYGFSL